MNSRLFITTISLLFFFTAGGQTNTNKLGNQLPVDLKRHYLEFRAIVDDYGANFVKAKGSELKNDLSELANSYKEYENKLPLSTARHSYLDNLNSRHLAFNANFGPYASKQDAEFFLSFLESFTDTAKTNCCTLVKERSTDNSGFPELSYKPEKYNGKNNSTRYHNFKITYRLKKSNSSMGNQATWDVVMRLFREENSGRLMF